MKRFLQPAKLWLVKWHRIDPRFAGLPAQQPVWMPAGPIDTPLTLTVFRSLHGRWSVEKAQKHPVFTLRITFLNPRFTIRSYIMNCMYIVVFYSILLLWKITPEPEAITIWVEFHFVSNVYGLFTYLKSNSDSGPVFKIRRRKGSYVVPVVFRRNEATARNIENRSNVSLYLSTCYSPQGS